MDLELDEGNIQLTQSDEDYECIKCHLKPDDVLIMTCEHNLCLDCAVKSMKEEIRKYSQMPNVNIKIVLEM